MWSPGVEPVEAKIVSCLPIITLLIIIPTISLLRNCEIKVELISKLAPTYVFEFQNYFFLVIFDNTHGLTNILEF